jgi:hypothetical protein
MPSANGAWLPLNRPHGACSSPRAADQQDTPTIMVDSMLQWDQLRTDYIREQLSNGTADTQLPIDGDRGGDSTNSDQMLLATAKLPASGVRLLFQSKKWATGTTNKCASPAIIHWQPSFRRHLLARSIYFSFNILITTR